MKLKNKIALITGASRGIGREIALTIAKEGADLAITGDGLTMYETAATGTPSIILSRFDSNKSVNNDFERMGSAIHLGDGTLVPAKVMAREVKHVLEDAGLRRSMSQRGKSFVDGKGLERIMAYIPESALKAY